MPLLKCFNVLTNTFSIINRYTNTTTFENDCCIVLNHLKAKNTDKQYSCELNQNNQNKNITDTLLFSIFEEISSIKPGWIYNTTLVKKIKLYEISLCDIHEEFTKLYSTSHDITTNTENHVVDNSTNTHDNVTENNHDNDNDNDNVSKNKFDDVIEVVTNTSVNNEKSTYIFKNPEYDDTVKSDSCSNIISCDDFNEDDYKKYAYIETDNDLNEYINKYLQTSSLYMTNVFTQTETNTCCYNGNTYSYNNANANGNKYSSPFISSVYKPYYPGAIPQISNVLSYKHTNPYLINQSNPPSMLIEKINNSLQSSSLSSPLNTNSTSQINSINNMFINELKQKLQQENFGLTPSTIYF